MFVQLKREGDIALYERRDDDGYRCWEVVRVRRSEGGKKVIGGVEVMFEPKEVYPSDEQFGVNGWGYGNREGAEDRYRGLTEPLKVSNLI
jgi:hypothetical protein